MEINNLKSSIDAMVDGATKENTNSTPTQKNTDLRSDKSVTKKVESTPINPNLVKEKSDHINSNPLQFGKSVNEQKPNTPITPTNEVGATRDNTAIQSNANPISRNNNAQLYKEFDLLNDYYKKQGYGDDQIRKQIKNLYDSGTIRQIHELGGTKSTNADNFDEVLQDYYMQGQRKLAKRETKEKFKEDVTNPDYFDLSKPWGNYVQDLDQSLKTLAKYADMKDDAIYNALVGVKDGVLLEDALRKQYKRNYTKNMYDYQRKFDYSDRYMDRFGENQFKERFEHNFGDEDTFIKKSSAFILHRLGEFNKLEPNEWREKFIKQLKRYFDLD